VLTIKEDFQQTKDLAIGSTALLTTMTDIIGFFSFLGLAKIIFL
jgi:magnesium transporter